MGRFHDIAWVFYNKIEHNVNINNKYKDCTTVKFLLNSYE